MNPKSPPEDRVALIDMDGTLCDCAGALERQLERLRGPGEETFLELGAEAPRYINERRKLIMRVPGFWRGLRPLPIGFQLIDILKSLGFDLYILTKGPSEHSLAWMEKVDWCRHHVPDIPIVMTEDKRLIRGSVFVEDWPPYITEWLRASPDGIVIAPAQPWNVNVEELFPGKCIRYDGANEDVIWRRLAGPLN